MVKHTAGTWRIQRNPEGTERRITISGEGGILADLDWGSLSEREANASLMAAAPEMLAALHKCIAIASAAGGHGIIPGRVIATARAAIVKATGEDV